MADAGSTAAEIGEALGVTPASAWTHMSRIGARPRFDAMTQEAIAEKVEDGWRHSRIARQHGIPEAMIPAIVEAVKSNTHILSNDRRGDNYGEPLRRGPKPKPRAAWTDLKPLVLTVAKLKHASGHKSKRAAGRAAGNAILGPPCASSPATTSGIPARQHDTPDQT